MPRTEALPPYRIRQYVRLIPCTYTVVSPACRPVTRNNTAAAALQLAAHARYSAASYLMPPAMLLSHTYNPRPNAQAPQEGSIQSANDP
jgi:uncharacterized protein YchJ